jgi:hypothetical protein
MIDDGPEDLCPFFNDRMSQYHRLLPWRRWRYTRFFR